MSKPDFLIIGAQKAGTTWLDEMFKNHPHIWTPPVKELQFFNELYMEDYFKWTKKHRELHSKKAIKWLTMNDSFEWDEVNLLSTIGQSEISHHWYQKIFSSAPTDTVKGEATPEYSLLRDDHVKQLHEVYPDTKIIFVLREPVSRTISHLKMRLLQEGFGVESTNEEISQFCKNEIQYWDFYERSNYASIISRWTHYFGTENCLFLLSEDLLEKPEHVLQKLSIFLGIDCNLFTGEVDKKIHISKSFSIGPDVYDAIKERLQNNIDWYQQNAHQYRLK